MSYLQQGTHRNETSTEDFRQGRQNTAGRTDIFKRLLREKLEQILVTSQRKLWEAYGNSVRDSQAEAT